MSNIIENLFAIIDYKNVNKCSGKSLKNTFERVQF